MAPTKDQTIRVSVTGQGGGKKGKKPDHVTVWIKIGNTPKKQSNLPKDKGECWENFRSKISRKVGHDAWSARIFGSGRKQEGKKWAGQNIKPEEGETVIVQIRDEEVSGIDIDPPPPIPERMIKFPKDIPLENRPIGLVPLDEILTVAPRPPNWAITHAEKQINWEVLSTLEEISRWPDPKYAGLFLRNAIAAAKFDSGRARPRSEDWENLEAGSPVKDLLVQLPLYKWPIPRDHGCFHPFCDHAVDGLQSSHLQRAHNRRTTLQSEKDSKIKRAWNGESTLQAT
jgi:hypothetical protein